MGLPSDAIVLFEAVLAEMGHSTGPSGKVKGARKKAKNMLPPFKHGKNIVP